MGENIKEDMLRLRKKGKTLYDIPRMYRDDELKDNDRTYFNEYKKELEVNEEERQLMDQAERERK